MWYPSYKYIIIKTLNIMLFIILNSIFFFIKEMCWEDDPKIKKILSNYVNFKDNGEYCSYYNFLTNLRDKIGLESNSIIYNLKNDKFFKGQSEYLYSKSFNHCYSHKNINDKKILKFNIDKKMKIV